MRKGSKKMLYNLYVFDHNVLHLCFWTLPALLLAIAMVAVGLVHGHRQEKRKKEFEEQLSDLYAKDTVESEQHI